VIACRHCKESFEPSRHSQICCSKLCRVATHSAARTTKRKLDNPLWFAVRENRDGIKMCPGCYAIKPLGEFENNKSFRLGVSSRCKQCLALYPSRFRGNVKQRCLKYYVKNKEKMNVANKKRYDKIKGTSEFIERQRRYTKTGVDQLDDSYIARRLGLPVRISTPLIPAKRAQLKLYRALKKGNPNV
jgi:hypothetical protein